MTSHTSLIHQAKSAEFDADQPHISSLEEVVLASCHVSLVEGVALQISRRAF